MLSERSALTSFTITLSGSGVVELVKIVIGSIKENVHLLHNGQVTISQ